MQITQANHQLHHQGAAILSLCATISEIQARWKPDPESWSILEVLNHLVDEEKLDFRQHLGHILHTPEDPWPEINPQGWVTEKSYNTRSLEESLVDFKTERETSIAWLSELQAPDWEAEVTSKWGSLSAGDMMTSWLAHDLLHLRQLIEICYQLNARACQPYDVTYAGQW